MLTRVLLVWLFLVCLLVPVRGAIVDRLALVVGQQTITQLQLDEEIRVTALLNRQPIRYDLETRRRAADRLVEQLLIRREMDQSRYPLPGQQDCDQYLEQIREQHGGAEALAKALVSYHLNEATLELHLRAQLTTLRFIEYRFRPDSTVSDEEIEAEYRRKVAAGQSSRIGPPPTLEASRETIRAVLLGERTDAELDNWLAESRKQVTIVYLDKSLE
jgi:parvulin-like peptidyl-prolyl isomerase